MEKRGSDPSSLERARTAQAKQALEVSLHLAKESPDAALALLTSSIEHTRSFEHAHLSALIKLYVIKPELKSAILSLADIVVKKADIVSVLENALRFVRDRRNYTERKTKSSKFFNVPHEIEEKIKKQIREVDPSWVGLTETPAMMQQEEQRILRQKPVEEIEDAETALTLASGAKAQDRFRFIQQYLKLGGNPRRPKYLRIHLNSVFNNPEDDAEPFPLIQTLFEETHFAEFKAWVLRNSVSTSTIPSKIAALVLSSFVVLAEDKLKEEEWSYVGERALALGQNDLARSAYAYLKKDEHRKTPQGQKTFELLSGTLFTERHDPNVRRRGSDILRITTSTPINSVARRTYDTNK